MGGMSETPTNRRRVRAGRPHAVGSHSEAGGTPCHRQFRNVSERSLGVASVLAELRRDRRGVSAIVLGLSLSTTLGFAGLAVDTGVWYNDKRSVQSVADLAAWTAAQTYYTEVKAGTASATAITDAQNAANAIASANGLAPGSGSSALTMNSPPQSGPNKGTAGDFEVIVSKPESLFFSSAFLHSLTVTGRAVAGGATTTTTTSAGSGPPGCILSLTNISLSNGVTVNAPNCAVDANGSTSSALSVIGGATLNADGISVVGSITQNNGGVITDSGQKVTGGAAVADPYASYTIAGAEAGMNMTCPNNTATTYSTWSATAYTLKPGVYCGGISVSNGVSVNFSPGIYIIDGGTFSLESGTNTATGGVTIVLTGNATFAIGNGATFAITAPSSGPTAGLAFFGDPKNTTTANFNGGTALTVNGAMYFPGQTVDFSNGSSNNAACTQLDAYNIVFTGGTNFSANCTGYGTQQIGGSSTTTTTTTTVVMLE